MKKLIVITIITVMVIFPACAQKGKSSLERLKDRAEMESWKSSGKKPHVGKKGQTIVVEAVETPKAPANAPAPEEEKSEDFDLSSLKELPETPPEQWVTVTGNNVPLRKGPGAQFKKIGVGQKADTFKLLRMHKLPNSNEIWYLVENKAGEKFFISEMLAQLTEVRETKAVASAPVTPAPAQPAPATPGPGAVQPPPASPPAKPADQVAAESKKEKGVEREVLGTYDKEALKKLQNVKDPTPPLPPELKDAKNITLNFEGTELYDVITTFAELLQLDYIVEGTIEGKVTLQTFNKIPVEDLYPVLEQILALHNVTVVRSGNFYRFLPMSEASRKPLSVFYGNDPSIPPHERMIIHLIALQHISVDAMQKIIQPLMSKSGTFINIPGTNNLMMVEQAATVHRLAKIVQALDVDKLASADIRLYKLTHANVEVVSTELEEIFTSIGYADAIGKTLTFLPITRMNALLAGNSIESLTPTIEMWGNKLDLPVSEGETSTFVYYVQNGDATALATLLNSIYQDKGLTTLPKIGEIKIQKTSATLSKAAQTKKEPASKTESKTPAPQVSVEGGISQEIEGEVTIFPDRDTNSIVIRTSPRNYSAILELVKKLDIHPQQVLIEVLIVDLSLTDTMESGIEWAYQSTKKGKDFAAGLNATGTASNGVGANIGGVTAGLASALTGGGSLIFNDPSKLIAQLELFASAGKADVLANPILVTADNKSASISIIDEIPIESAELVTPTTGGSTTSTSIEFKDVGIKLDILPKINSEDFVNLQISQEISSQGDRVNLTTAGRTSPSFRKRQVKTEVVLKDKQVLVMGGLMRKDITNTKTGIPGLMDIPYVGRLFSTVSDTERKTELMLFITPHVISSPEDSSRVTKQFERRLGDLSSYVKRG